MAGSDFSHIRRCWTDRNGDHYCLDVFDTTLSEADAAARSWGWPGHRGGWWNYLKDDLRSLVARLTPVEDG